MERPADNVDRATRGSASRLIASPLRRVLVGVSLLGALTGCAVFDAMEAQVKAGHQKDVAAFPDQPLVSSFVAADGTPATGYACEPCGFYFKRPEDPNYFLTIDRKGPRVHDQAALVAMNAASPIETTDVGVLFLQTARGRGNSVAVYGAPVNERILALSSARQPGQQGAWYATNASSCLVEVDPTGAFVSILAVGYELSYGVIVTNSDKARDVFTQQRLFLLPKPTARFVQERLGADFRENYRIR